MTNPLISVIVPAYNSERYIAEAIDSISKQEYHPIEILVIDDGSTDSTPGIVGSLSGPIQYFRQDNRGPSAARNVGLRHAEGDLIAFLDADDLWPERKLKLQSSRLDSEPRLDVVLGRVQYIGELDDVESNLRFERDDKTVMNVNLGCGLFRRPVFDRVGYLAEDLRHFEDHDWFLRAREAGVQMSILKETTLLYRRHDESTTRMNKGETNILAVLKRSLDRRHAAGEHEDLPRFFDLDDQDGET